MITDTDHNNVVASIVAEKRFSHCRLCLSEIGKEYVRFHDMVSCNTYENIQRPLSELLTTLLGEEICDEISGVDAVCPSCVDNTLNCWQFINRCEKSTAMLKKIFINLSNALDLTDKIPQPENTQSLYIRIDQTDFELVFTGKPKMSHNKCLHCDESFENQFDLQVHHCPFGDGTLTCRMCFQVFDSEINLKNHDCKMSCKICISYESNEKKLKEHQMKVHSIFICKDCGKACKGFTRLKAHEESHAAQYNCSKCGKLYLTKHTYLKHVELCLKDQIDPHPYRSKLDKMFTCADCGKGYSTFGGLRVHEKFVHGNGKYHCCPVCNKKFIAPSCLKLHMVKHTGEKNFKCSICSNNFVSKEALLYHTRRHTGEKPYSCKLCNEKFVNASARAEHIKYKHLPPKLECPICFRKLYTNSFLKIHMKRHDNPASKLYVGKNMAPPNMPSTQNIKWSIEVTE